MNLKLSTSSYQLCEIWLVFWHEWILRLEIIQTCKKWKPNIFNKVIYFFSWETKFSTIFVFITSNMSYVKLNHFLCSDWWGDLFYLTTLNVIHLGSSKVYQWSKCFSLQLLLHSQSVSSSHHLKKIYVVWLHFFFLIPGFLKLGKTPTFKTSVFLVKDSSNKFHQYIIL